MKKFISLILFFLLVISGTAFAGGTIQWPTACFFDSNGDPLSGGWLNSYVAGTNTRKSLYSDRECTSGNAHTNPEELDSNGCTEVYGIGTYKLVLTDAAEAVTYFTDDNVTVSAQSVSVYYPNYNATDICATGNSDTIKYAVDTISTDSGTIVLQHNSGGATTTYTCSSNETIPANVRLIIEKGALLADDASNANLTINGPIKAGDYQIFNWGTGSGDIIFGAGIVPFAFVDWFGNNATPGTTDMTTAFQEAVDTVGNAAEILITKLIYLTDEITLPAGGGTISGSTSKSYYIADGANRYHIKNGIGDDITKTLIWGPLTTLKGAWTIKDLNINMNGSTSTGIGNEDNAAGSTRFYISNINLDDCGKIGIHIKPGGGAAEIRDSFVAGPDGFLTGEAFTTDFVNLAGKFLSGSVGIFIEISDCVVSGNEVKGGFEYGIWFTSTEGELTNNNSDQNHIGIYVKWGRAARVIGNRGHLNILYGLQTQGTNYTFIGNTFSNNNSDREATGGGYDGVGALLTQCLRCMFVGNMFSLEDDGFEFVEVDDSYFIGNANVSLDGDLYNYAGNDVTARRNVGFDLNLGHFYLWNNTLSASLVPTNFGHEFDTLATFNAGSAKKPLIQALTGDLAINPGDGGYLKLTPDQSGWAVTLDTGYTHSEYTGGDLIVWNTSATFTFTFEGVIIPPSTVYNFVIVGTDVVRRIGADTLRTVVILTAAQVEALATPIVIVPAPGAGKIIEFVSATLAVNYSGSGNWQEPSAPDELVFEYDSGLNVTAELDATGFIDQTNDEMRLMLATPLDTAGEDMIGSINDGLFLHNTGGNYVDSDAVTSTLIVTVTYRVHETGL